MIKKLAIATALIATTSLFASPISGYTIQNKNYTFEQVTEILSDKIIELQKRINTFSIEGSKTADWQEKKIQELELRINNLEQKLLEKNRITVGQPFLELEKQAVEAEAKESTIETKEEVKKYPSKFQEIIMDRELYEKVKNEPYSN